MRKAITRREFLRVAGGTTGALIAAGAGGFATSARAATGAKVLKLGHTLALDSPYQKWAVKFSELLKAKTNGRYTVEVFPQSQLGGEVQMIQAARAGTQDALITAQAIVEATVKEWELFDLPYLFDSVDQGNKVLAGHTGQIFLDMLPKYGVVGLSWGSVIERDVFTFSKPVRTLADLKGMKIRVMQSPGYVAAYRALGANPTPLAYSQLYLALKERTVDGGDTSPDQFFQDKFAEICKYFSLTHVNYLPAVMLVSKSAVWDTLSASDKDAFLAAGREAADDNRRVYKATYNEYLGMMKAPKVELIRVDTAPWVKATEGVRRQLSASIPEGVKLLKMIDSAKA